MSKKDVRPSTLVGIKRLAKSVKAELGVPLAMAQDIAAQRGGYQNLRHAQNVLARRPHSPARDSRHSVYLTAYWREKESDASGRETFRVELPCPMSDLLRRDQFDKHRALVHFRPEAPDHLVRSSVMRTQSMARRDICAIARVLQFMVATGLRPSKGHSRAYPGGRAVNAIPGHDHTSIWYDGGTKRYLLVDEPYEAAARSKATERKAWADTHDWTVLESRWPGMYAPDKGSRMFLISDSHKGIALEEVEAALGTLPRPVVEQDWSGESAPMLPHFFSPGTPSKATEDAGTAAAKPKPTGPRNTVAYVQTFVGPRRRPNVRMPIAAHAEAGALLKSVLARTYHRKGVHGRVDLVRSDLDEWVQREYTSTELPGDQFFDLYYRESGATPERHLSDDERGRHMDSLERAKAILLTHYPDCAPLRDLIGKLNGAQASLRTWR